MQFPVKTGTTSRARAGFTIIEILVVLGIIGALAAVLIPYITGQLQQSRVSTTKIQLRKLQGNIETFNVNIGQLPETLKDLVRRPTNEELANKWMPGVYAKDEKDLNDAWGNKFQYVLTPGEQHPYELFSYGPQGKGAPKQERISVWNL